MGGNSGNLGFVGTSYSPKNLKADSSDKSRRGTCTKVLQDKHQPLSFLLIGCPFLHVGSLLIIPPTPLNPTKPTEFSTIRFKLYAPIYLKQSLGGRENEKNEFQRIHGI